MRVKRFVVEIIVAEQIQNENMDSIYLKKAFEMCIGKEDTLHTLEKLYNDIKEVVETKLKENDR